MIKKITAYCFILTANIVLLAHAVLPHHYHEQQVCVERTHCMDDDAIHTYNSTEHNHEHDGTESTTCVLKQAVIIPSSQGKLSKSCDNCTDTHSRDFFILSNFGYAYLQPVSEVVTNIPEFPSFLTSFVTSTLGLRAPPKNKC